MTGSDAGPIRVAVVDDHELVRSGICNALSMTPEIAVMGEAGDGLAALELMEREKGRHCCSTCICPAWTASPALTR